MLNEPHPVFQLVTRFQQSWHDFAFFKIFYFSCFLWCLNLLVNSKYHENDTKNSELPTVITTPNLNHSLSSRNLLAILTIYSKITIIWSSDSTQKFNSLLANDELIWLVRIHQFTTPRNKMNIGFTHSRHANIHITIRLRSLRVITGLR